MLLLFHKSCLKVQNQHEKKKVGMFFINIQSSSYSRAFLRQINRPPFSLIPEDVDKV